MLNLNTISKEELFNEILLNEDLNDFYITLDEKKFLSFSYELEELKEMLESWLINNCDNF